MNPRLFGVQAPLTALHVAKEVSICSASEEGRVELLLKSEGGKPRWVRAIGGSDETVHPFAVDTIHELASKYRRP